MRESVDGPFWMARDKVTRDRCGCGSFGHADGECVPHPDAWQEYTDAVPSDVVGNL